MDKNKQDATEKDPSIDIRDDQLNQLKINKDLKKLQFGIAPIPYHVHNGTDAPNISFPAIVSKTLISSYTIQGTSAATATNYSVFFIAPQTMSVLAIWESHTSLGTDAGAVSLQIEKLTGTKAPGSGSILLTNNSSAGFNLKAAINTVQTGTLTIPATLGMLVTDRLAFKLTGTPTSVANVTITMLIAF